MIIALIYAWITLNVGGDDVTEDGGDPTADELSSLAVKVSCIVDVVVHVDDDDDDDNDGDDAWMKLCGMMLWYKMIYLTHSLTHSPLLLSRHQSLISTPILCLS
jgi:hypothetical protein